MGAPIKAPYKPTKNNTEASFGKSSSILTDKTIKLSFDQTQPDLPCYNDPEGCLSGSSGAAFSKKSKNLNDNH